MIKIIHIGATSYHGKTETLLKLAFVASKLGKKVFFYSDEETPLMLTNRYFRIFNDDGTGIEFSNVLDIDKASQCEVLCLDNNTMRGNTLELFHYDVTQNDNVVECVYVSKQLAPCNGNVMF